MRLQENRDKNLRASTEAGLESARESAWQRELRVTGRNPQETYMNLQREELEKAMYLNKAKEDYENQHSLLNLEPKATPEGKTKTLISKVNDPNNSQMMSTNSQNSNVVEIPMLQMQ